jgi:hypothetical protein
VDVLLVVEVMELVTVVVILVAITRVLVVIVKVMVLKVDVRGRRSGVCRSEGVGAARGGGGVDSRDGDMVVISGSIPSNTQHPT